MLRRFSFFAFQCCALPMDLAPHTGNYCAAPGRHYQILPSLSWVLRSPM
jgi:hypothetical protein